MLTSNGTGVAPSFQTLPASSGVTSVSTTISGSSVDFTPTTGTVVMHVTDANSNTLIGQSAGNTTLVGLGASNNTGVGYQSLHSLTTGNLNTALGWNSLLALTTGQYNVGIGENAGVALTTGSTNTFLGDATGTNYTGAETGNILIGFDVRGTLGESNVIRIGNAGNGGDTPISATFIDGINGITVAGPLVNITSTGQLGTLALGTAGQLLQSSGAAGSISPVWTTATYPSTVSSGQILYASSTDVISGLTTQTNGVLTTDASGLPSINNIVTPWTPVITFGGLSVGITYAAAVGGWYQVGQVIFFDCTVILTNKGTSIGNVAITGLTAPYNPARTYIGTISANDIIFLGMVNARIPSGTTTISIDQWPSGGARTSLTDTSFANDSYVEISGSYLIS